MGAMAEGLVAYMRPLIDQTDGSMEQMKKAVAIGQFCYNLALLPKDSRNDTLNDARKTFQMDDKEFESFQQTVVVPMLHRHQQMFPRLHRPASASARQFDAASRAEESRVARVKLYPGTEPYVPCPCQSGRKYKFCCGKSR